MTWGSDPGEQYVSGKRLWPRRAVVSGRRHLETEEETMHYAWGNNSLLRQRMPRFGIRAMFVALLITGQAYGGKTRGPFRLHPHNPRYFTDGTRKAIYLTGSHVGWELQDDAWGREHVFDYPGFLDFLVEHNHNLVRMWVVEHTRWDTSNPKAVASPMPWRRTGPGRALDGQLKFDLKQFEAAFFHRLRSRIIAADERGIYVIVMLFQGFSVHKRPGRNPWFGHPFNKRNNINGIDGDLNADGDGREVHTLASGKVTELQEAYVRKVIDTVNDLDNVLYEIANEAGNSSTEWQYHMIRFIKKYQATKPNQHLVGMTVQIPGGHNNNEVLLRSPADWISPNAEGGYRDNPPAGNGRKVIISDTDHLWGVGGNSRQWVWKSFFRGLNPIYMDSYTDQETKQLDKIVDREFDPRWEPIRRAMGYTRRLANRISLVGMVPRNELASSRYCMANPGKEYLIYLPEGGSVTVDLRDVGGALSVEWFNARRAESKTAERAQGGAKRIFASPFGGDDAVLHLEASK